MDIISQIEKQLPETFDAYNYKTERRKFIDFCKDLKDKGRLNVEKVKEGNLLRYVLVNCENSEKQSLKPELFKRVLHLERHAYAPELNELHFNSISNHSVCIKTSGCLSIGSAIDYIIECQSIQNLKGLILSAKPVKTKKAKV